jgi:signal peptidase I
MHVHFLKSTVTIMPAFMAGFDFIGCPQQVSGRSMRPTFNEAPLSTSWVWLSKWHMLVMPRRSRTRLARCG